MTAKVVVIPSPDSRYISLSGADADGGKLFRKQILPMNKSFIHPGDHKTKIFVDEKMAKSLVDNFKASYCDIVQLPIVGKDNQHSEDPRDNVGRVVGLDYDDKGVYATLSVQKHAEDFGKTILGASAFLHLNYIDTATGNRVGPTLLHLAPTNRPHITGLGGYEEILKASADNLGDTENILFMSEEENPTTPTEEEGNSHEEEPEDAGTEPVVTPEADDNQHSDKEENETMTKEELIAALKEQGVDVEALQAEAGKVAELSAQLNDVNDQLKLSGEKALDFEDLASSYVELSNVSKSLADKVEALEKSNQEFVKASAEREVDDLIEQGRAVPAQRDHLVKLSLTDREMFEGIVPKEPVVKLSGEKGYGAGEEPNKDEFASHIERYKAMVKGN